MNHATSAAGVLALLAALAAGSACAQQQGAVAPPQAERIVQAQRAGNTAGQEQRDTRAQPVPAQPQGQPGEQAPAQAGPLDPVDSQQTRSGKPPPPRRNVPANVATMPRPAAPPAYGPVLHDMAPQTPVPAPAPAGLPNPEPLNSCTGGQCRDTSGNSYNTGVGNAAISGDGKLCNRSGNTMQCF